MSSRRRSKLSKRHHDSNAVLSNGSMSIGESEKCLEYENAKEEVSCNADLASPSVRSSSIASVSPTLHSPPCSENSTYGRKIGRKRKLAAEERMLLAQLYYEHFSIYHSKRYLGPDYIDGVANLKQWLINDWSQQLTSLGISERTPIDIGNRINEMLIEVADFRTQNSCSFNMQMSPSFLLFNKVYDLIYQTHAKVEQLLDKFERAVCQNSERLRWQQLEPSKPWTVEENALLAQLYNVNSKIYNVLPIRRKDAAARDALLGSWSSKISELGIAIRTPIEIEEKLGNYRSRLEETFEFNNPGSCGRVNGKRQRRECSPTLRAISESLATLDYVDYEFSLDDLFTQVKEVQEELLKESQNVGTVESGLSIDEHLDDVDNKLLEPDRVCIPPLSGSSTSVGRTNRPHMSRSEKHLLGLLYRQQHENYERFNNPHIARKTPGNKKWKLLKDWAEKLTTLGVSKREPDELATKISQYKNIVKSHKQCMEGGLDSMYFSNEYKMRRCLRPLSPTTKLYDVSDKTVDETECTDSAIIDYINEAKQSNVYGVLTSDRLTFRNSSRRTYFYNDMQSVHPVRSSETELPEEKGNAGKEDVASNTSEFDATSSESPLSKHVPITLDTILGSGNKKSTDDDVEVYNKVFNTVFDDMRALEREGGEFVVVYDSVDSSGHVTRMAVSRCISDRDTNFFIWTRYLDIEVEMPLTMFVCYMCEQMAQSVSVANTAFCKRGQVLGYMPNSTLLAQQSLPSLVLAPNCKPVNISWVRGAPRHRCVPFLMSTMSEKMAEISHMLVRVEPHDLT